jgi:purine-binding chemotaxis protein CheW
VTGPAPIDRRAALLREAFDRTFALAPPARDGERIELLAITVGGVPYALQMSEVEAVVACRKIAPLPSRRAELLGAAGVRGNLVTVYALDALLGERAGHEHKSVAWLAIYKHEAGIGVGFEQVDGLLRVPAGDVHPLEASDASAGDRRRASIRAIARHEGGARPIVDLSVTLSMTTRGSPVSSPEEH